MIYLIQYDFDGSPTKIGFTANQSTLTTRMKAFNTASAWPIKVLALRSGTKRTEYDIHTEFATFHMHGEWFRTEGPVKSWIEEVCRLESLPLLEAARTESALHHPPRTVRVG